MECTDNFKFKCGITLWRKIYGVPENLFSNRSVTYVRCVEQRKEKKRFLTSNFILYGTKN